LVLRFEDFTEPGLKRWIVRFRRCARIYNYLTSPS
jgi:hypothetical protein